MQIAVGSVIAGKYQIERPLARGGMGSVWVARHVKLGSRLAVKFLDPRFAATPSFIERFEREARAAAALESPHVVQVRDYGVEDETPYLVMELLDGEDLGARLTRLGRLSLPETARILKQIGKALRKAHDAGIVHRDIKPANLFVTRVDDEEVIKVLDFGIAKETASAVGEATKTGEVMGSPHYMSPEQASAEKGVDHRADLWSVGVILYRMVTGALPFPGEAIGAVLSRILVHPVPPVHAAAPDLPTSLDDFFAKALAKPKEQRFQSIRDLIDAFVAISGGVPVGPTGAVTLATSVPDAASSLDPDSGNTNVATIPLPAAGVLPFQKPPHGAPPAGNPPPPPVDASAGTLTAANTSRDTARPARSAALPVAITGIVLLIGAGGALGWRALQPESSAGLEAPATSEDITQPVPATPPLVSPVGDTTATDSGTGTAPTVTASASPSPTTAALPTAAPTITTTTTPSAEVTPGRGPQPPASGNAAPKPPASARPPAPGSPPAPKKPVSKPRPDDPNPFGL